MRLPLYLQRRMALLGLLGFASGLPLALTGSTLTLWLSRQGVDKTAIGIFAMVSAPYTVKFLWSHLVDHLPIPWLDKLLGRRRSWILAAQAGLILAIMALGSSAPSVSLAATAWLALLVSALSATQDIAIDAYRVESLPEQEQGAGAAILVFGYRVGMLTSGAGALLLADRFGWATAYHAAACLMAIGMAAVLLAPRQASSRREDEMDRADGKERAAYGAASLCLAFALWTLWRFRPDIESALALTFTFPWSDLPSVFPLGQMLLWLGMLAGGFILAGAAITLFTGKTLRHTVILPFSEILARPRWGLILAFILLFKLGDAFVGQMFNPFLNEMGFSLTEIAAIVKTYGLIATLAGAFAGGWAVQKLGLLPSLWVCGFLQMASNLIFIWQFHAGHNAPVLYAVVSVENFTGGMGIAVFVAYISSLCDIRYTATHYALLSSLASVGRTFLSAASGYSADMLGWTDFFLLSTALHIPSLVMLYWLGRKRNR